MNRRIALCIGVANYQEQKLLLENPVNDAQCMNIALKSRGFDSTLLLDPTADVLVQALSDLSTKISSEEGGRVLGVVFYAGHAIEVGGFGVVMPADMPYPVSPNAIFRSGVSVLEIVQALNSVKGAKIVIIDACRDANPIAAWDQFQVQQFNAWVDAETLRMKDAAEADEVAIAYSTSAGQKAYEGAGMNSLYCEKLQASLLRHDNSIVEALTLAGRHVTEETRAKQRPWVYTNLSMKSGFSDLPTYALVSSTTLNDKQVSGARLHVRAIDDSLVANTDGQLQFIKDGLVTGSISHPSTLTTASFWRDEVLLAGPKKFVSIDANSQDEQGHLRNIAEAKTKCAKPHGISLGPDGTFAIVYGNGGYSVLRRAGTEWKTYYSGTRPSDVYGAVFQCNDVAYLCGSGNYVTRLKLGGGKPKLNRIYIDNYLHVYDMAWISNQRSIAAVCNEGVVVWIDVDSLKTRIRRMFEWPSIDVPGAYGRLRRMELSPEEANLYLEDPERFDAGTGKKVWPRLYRKERPDYHLLCCALAADSRVLAIGADAGLVFLIDVRSRWHFATLNAGSDIGAPLQWMACTANGAIHVLADDGIIRSFEPVLPPV